MDMPNSKSGVLHRVLWLYGLHGLLSNFFFLFGYFLLPEGFMRGLPQMAAAEWVARATGFWPQLGLTLLFNLGVAAPLGVVCNFQAVRGFPAGYLIPIVLGITGGLVAGTNSFLASDLSNYSAREGLALGLSIGGLEMLAYILIVAATVPFGVYQYRSWWRWGREWKPTKTMNLRDVRLSREEWVSVAIGVGLLIVAAYRETLMAMGRL